MIRSYAEEIAVTNAYFEGVGKYAYMDEIRASLILIVKWFYESLVYLV